MGSGGGSGRLDVEAAAEAVADVRSAEAALLLAGRAGSAAAGGAAAADDIRLPPEARRERATSEAALDARREAGTAGSGWLWLTASISICAAMAWGIAEGSHTQVLKAAASCADTCVAKRWQMLSRWSC